ncbi:11834_t:CDS:2, partial [Diversispora eburnea]
KESEESIVNVTKEILSVLKDIWNNFTFSSEFAKTLSEGTYQLTIILPAIRASLKNLPIGDSFFISTSEKQSVASANRKGDGFMGRLFGLLIIANAPKTEELICLYEITRKHYLSLVPELLKPKVFGDKETDEYVKMFQRMLGYISDEMNAFQSKRIEESGVLQFQCDEYISKIFELKAQKYDLEYKNKNQKYLIDELKKQLESSHLVTVEGKKNHKFQEKCILIAQILFNEEPVVEYRSSFMEDLELDAFFRINRIALETQGAQHRLHHTGWYKDIKKLEDIVNRDRKKKTLCHLNRIYLIEVWYDEKPEIVIPQKINKIKEFINRESFDLS